MVPTARYFLPLVIILSACGDASQELRAVQSDNTLKANVDLDADAEIAPSFVPLVSQYLALSAESLGSSPVLEDIQLSSVIGHLIENIHSEAETLGLNSIPHGLWLSSSPSPLPDGLAWELDANLNTLPLMASAYDTDRAVISEAQLKLDGIQVHNAKAKMIVERGETTWISGSRPSWLISTRQPSRTPFSVSVGKARQYAARELSFPEWRFQNPSKVYISEKSRARAAYLFTVSAEYRANERAPWVPLEVALDADLGKVLWQRPLAMHASATALLHVENRAVSSVPEQVILPDMRDGVLLSHELFEVYNCGRSARFLENSPGRICQQRATASAGTFNIQYSDSNYDDLVAYAGITRAMAKFRFLDQSSLRPEWDSARWPGSRSNFGLENSTASGSPKRLMVFVNTETQSPTKTACGQDTTPDNAQYLWQGPTGSGNPEILIGYGGLGSSRCGVFQDLGKDMDVVMHEFGHHMVFRGLSNTKQQSIALHEGFSDYLTYAITGNNLLGENTSPGRSALRIGTTRQRTFSRFSRKSDGTYITVLQALGAPHLVGELWSGILWEMRTALGRDSSNSFKMDKIVWDSIDLLKGDGELYDGVLAISESAKRYAERFGDDAQQIQKIIHKIFVDYEFAALTPDGKLVRSAFMGSSSTLSEPQKTSTKKKSWGCGDISLFKDSSKNATPNASSALSIAFLLLLPILMSSLSGLIPKRVRLLARLRTRKRKN